jgi:hypothetical protein
MIRVTNGAIVANENDDLWLAVIGKSLAYLCLKQAEKAEPNKLSGILAKVDFLKGLGLSQAAAADAVGSSPASVTELIRQQRAKKNAKTRGTGRGAKKKARR